jgi:hypothetical protein
VRNLPTGVTSGALDPVVALAQAGLDLQQDPEHGGIGLGAELLHVLMLPDFERAEPVLTQRRSSSLI